MTAATLPATQQSDLPPWNTMRQAMRSTFLLGARELRTVWRMPAILIPSLIVPVFFYFVMVGSLDQFAEQFGISNWEAFQIPIAIMFAVQSGGAGLNMVADIESGYFDKLLLTPTSRLAILVGAMAADFVRIMFQAALVVGLAVLAGGSIATGFPGAVAIIIISSVWGLAFSAIGFAIALKTGNSQATQSVWVLFMPFMFLTTAFAPLEAMATWLRTAARFNPMTYLLDGLRALAMTGWDMGDILGAVAAALGLGTVTITWALFSLKSRLK